MAKIKEKTGEDFDGVNFPRPSGCRGTADWFLARRVRCPVFCLPRCRRGLDASFARGWAASDRSEERFAGESNTCNGAIQAGPTGAKGLSQTVKLNTVRAEDFDSVFYPGGHGPMWDLAADRHSIRLLESFYNSGKPIALVCHSPGVLRHGTHNGEPLVKGKHVTGFTNGEEKEVQLTDVVPFLVEDELLRLGAIFEKVKNWQPFSVIDGRLITGQNPASSTSAAKNLLKVLGQQAFAAAS